MEENYKAIGKRKTSIAKVYLENGSGKIVVNGKSLKDYFLSQCGEEEKIKTPLILLNLVKAYDLKIFVKGGGISAQIDAIRLGISKALSEIKQEYRSVLKKNFLLNRDARIKERRKYGLRKARKAPQYSKR